MPPSPPIDARPVSAHVRSELERSLRRIEQRFRLLVEQVTEYAMIVLDPDGTIETWNAGAERLKGYAAEEAIGCHFSLFYTDDDRRDRLPERLLEQARQLGSVEHTGWRVRRDGTQFWGDVIITALQDDSGDLFGFAKVTRDLTARKRFEDARETFFDTFAHDFRGPVTVIEGFAELLSTAAPEDRAGHIERILTNARRLTAMTSDLVEHSRVQSNSDELPLEPLDLRDVVETTVGGLSEDPSTVRVRIDVPRLRVLGERAALERILVNLLANALRYSPDDTTVRVGATESDGHIRLSVADQGRGIEPEDLPRIFDHFERGRLASDDGGSGLGLTSVKLLVERMGGRVAIASEPGVGTTVTVELTSA
ncbi:hypothetical protein BH09ACT12_BH09ACT12_21110 [soil metagenome]